jgi:hypothetical protein
MHQGHPVNYDGFDPGTGHSVRAVKGLMDRLKKQYITGAKPGDGAATIATSKGNAPATKKRARAAKVSASATEETEARCIHSKEMPWLT